MAENSATKMSTRSLRASLTLPWLISRPTIPVPLPQCLRSMAQLFAGRPSMLISHGFLFNAILSSWDDTALLNESEHLLRVPHYVYSKSAVPF
jgi:hypothetical protein